MGRFGKFSEKPRKLSGTLEIGEGVQSAAASLEIDHALLLPGVHDSWVVSVPNSFGDDSVEQRFHSLLRIDEVLIDLLFRRSRGSLDQGHIPS